MWAHILFLSTPPCWSTSCFVSLRLGPYLFLKYWKSLQRSCSLFLVGSFFFFFFPWPHVFSWGNTFQNTACLASSCSKSSIYCVGQYHRFILLCCISVPLDPDTEFWFQNYFFLQCRLATPLWNIWVHICFEIWNLSGLGRASGAHTTSQGFCSKTWVLALSPQVPPVVGQCCGKLGQKEMHVDTIKCACSLQPVEQDLRPAEDNLPPGSS